MDFKYFKDKTWFVSGIGLGRRHCWKKVQVEVDFGKSMKLHQEQHENDRRMQKW